MVLDCFPEGYLTNGRGGEGLFKGGSSFGELALFAKNTTKRVEVISASGGLEHDGTLAEHDGFIEIGIEFVPSPSKVVERIGVVGR